jgi:hypothetical protein
MECNDISLMTAFILNKVKDLAFAYPRCFTPRDKIAQQLMSAFAPYIARSLMRKF